MTEKHKVSWKYVLTLLKAKFQLGFNAIAWVIAIYVCNRDGQPLPIYVNLTGMALIVIIYLIEMYYAYQEEFTPKLQAKL